MALTVTTNQTIAAAGNAHIRDHYLRAALEAFFTGVDDAPTD